MNEQLKTVNGIVIKEIKTKESDKVITVFTKELGVVNIYVKGGMRLKNKFHSATNMFVLSEFVVFKSNKSDLYNLNEATVKHIFHRLSDNIEYMALAMYMSELLCEIDVPNDMNNEILRLYLNILHMLTAKKWSVLLCKSVFEMRLLSDTGFRPDMIGCARCRKYEAELFFFDISNARIICSKCMMGGENYITGYFICEMPVVMALRYIAYADLDQMFTFNLESGYVKQLTRICEEYVLYHTKNEYKALNFFKMIVNY